MAFVESRVCGGQLSVVNLLFTPWERIMEGEGVMIGCLRFYRMPRATDLLLFLLLLGAAQMKQNKIKTKEKNKRTNKLYITGPSHT